MPRPYVRLLSNEKRTEHLHIRLTHSQRVAFQREAKKAGLSFTAWCLLMIEAARAADLSPWEIPEQ